MRKKGVDSSRFGACPGCSGPIVVVITSHLDTLLGTKISPLLKVPLTKMILTTSRFHGGILVIVI